LPIHGAGQNDACPLPPGTRQITVVRIHASGPPTRDNRKGTGFERGRMAHVEGERCDGGNCTGRYWRSINNRDVCLEKGTRKRIWSEAFDTTIDVNSPTDVSEPKRNRVYDSGDAVGARCAYGSPSDTRRLFARRSPVLLFRDGRRNRGGK